MARTGKMKRKDPVSTGGRPTRGAKLEANKTLKSSLVRAESFDSMRSKFEEASLVNSPTKSKDEELYSDKEEFSCQDEDEVCSNNKDEEEIEALPRKSGRVSRTPSDPISSITASSVSTPRKRNMKKRGRKNITMESKAKRQKKSKSTGSSLPAAKIVPLKVDGKALPGRETEFQEISQKLSTAIRSDQDLSGVPGTGKTATTREVIGALQKDKKVPSFDYIEINGMKLGDPSQVYPLLWRHLFGGAKLVSSNMALKNLKGYFSASPRPVVVLLDELDALLQRKHSILYHFFEWTGLDSAKLIIVAIANTMDLPERLLSNRISSRMGLNRINFVPYQYGQLQQIILHRLAKHKSWFHLDALEMCGRKVSSVSGDARRAIAFATRAVDYIKAESKRLGHKAPAPGSISLSVMQRILASAFTGSPVSALSSCSGLQSLMLDVISSSWNNQLTAYDSSFYTVCERFWQKCRNCGVDLQPSMAVVKSNIFSLASAGLIRLEPSTGQISVTTKLVPLFSDSDLQLARRQPVK